jgi:vacuolar-type H+-ATPase subunit I/STV1
MSDPEETVDRLFEDAERLLADSTADRQSIVGNDDLQSIAAEASELVESTATGGLLAAVGFDVDEESDPIDLVSAVSDADAEPLVQLRRLKLLTEVDQAEDAPAEALEEFESFSESRSSAGEESDDAFDTLEEALSDAAERLDALRATDSDDERGEEDGENEETGGRTDDTNSGRLSTGHSTIASTGRSNRGRPSHLSTVSRAP